MVLTDQPALAVAHLPKTGGSWLRHTLQGSASFAGYRHVLGTHDPAWCLYPELRRGRTMIGTWRAPAPWYASLWLHAVQGDAGEQTPGAAQYGLGFRAFLYGATHPSERELAQPLGVIVAPRGTEPADLQRSGVGLATWALAAWYGRPGAHRRRAWHELEMDALLDTDRLPEAVAELVPGFDPGAHPPVGTRHDRKRRNVAPPADYRDWYDAEMLSWVLEADAPLLAARGTDDPFGPSPRAVTSRIIEEAA